MSVSTNDFKNGMTLDLDGTLFQVVEFQHVKPGKGGAFVRTKLRNVKTGAVVDKTFNAGVKVGLAIVERKEMQYLYPEGADLVFMDLQTYEQLHVPGGVVGDVGKYLTEGGQATVATHPSPPGPPARPRAGSRSGRSSPRGRDPRCGRSGAGG